MTEMRKVVHFNTRESAVEQERERIRAETILLNWLESELDKENKKVKIIKFIIETRGRYDELTLVGISGETNQ